jgi:hypothetical protein
MNRRRVALSLAILWIVGFELVPWLHIALHGHLAPHHHDANGADILDDHDSAVDEHAPAHHDDGDHDDADHEHGDDDLDADVDEHGVPVHLAASKAAEDRDATSDHEKHLLAALEHGAHSLAHHGIAVPVPAPAVTSPLPVDRRPITLAELDQPAWLSAAIPEASARGPPAFLV